jgi:hypothetical protein
MLKAPKNYYKFAMINFIKSQPNQIANGPQLVKLYNTLAENYYGLTLKNNHPKANMHTQMIPMNVYKFMKINGQKLEVEGIHQYKFNF